MYSFLNHRAVVASFRMVHLTDVERKIAKSVVKTFLSQKESSPRLSLVRVFKDPNAIERLGATSILKSQDGRQTFLPTILAFHYCGDAETLQVGKDSVKLVTGLLRNLFYAHRDNPPHTAADLDMYADKVLDVPPFGDELKLGLFLAQDLAGILASWHSNPQHTEVTQFQIAEHIVTKEADQVWDEYVHQRSEQIGTVMTPAGNEETTKVEPDSRKVFLVHGHDEAAKQSVARLLEKLGLQPIILHEQPNKGQTVIEKFEANSDVGFAVVLLTPDDVGRATSDKKLKPRARQNVVLELGYFFAKLGRARVCALYKGVELPSDVVGVIYAPYDEHDGWRVKLANEIRAAGLRSI
jgi:predicted nucleotide-binding protein